MLPDRDHRDRRAVCLIVPERFPDRFLAALCAGLGAGSSAAQRRVRAQRWFTPADEESSEVVVVVAQHIVDLGQVRELMSQDVAHLPIAFSSGTAQVGPLVVPGSTACLCCVYATRADADPDWPRYAVSTIGRDPIDLDETLATSASVVAAQLIDAAARAPLNVSVTVEASSWQRSEQVHRPHAACGCLSPAGNARVGVPVALPPRKSGVSARPG